MSDFIAHIKAQLDDGGVESKLQTLCKDRPVSLIVKDIDQSKLDTFLKGPHYATVEISASSLSGMKTQIESALKNIKISPTLDLSGLSGRSGIGKVGDLLSKQAQAAIKGVTNRSGMGAFRVDQIASGAFQKEMSDAVKRISGRKSELISYDIKTKSRYDDASDATITTLDKAIVKYRNDLGEVITKQLEWTQIATSFDPSGNAEAIMGWAEATASYSNHLEAATKQAKSFADTQKSVAANLKNTAKQIYQGAIDPNATKKIQDTAHLDELKRRKDAIDTEIGNLSSLTGSDFNDKKLEIQGMISDLKILTREYRNAESAATSFRAKPVETIRSETDAKVKSLEADIKKYGIESKELTGYVDDMNKALSNPDIDMSGLQNVLDTYTKAKAEMGKLVKESQAAQASEKVGIKADTLSKTIGQAVADNAGLEKFETTINGAKVSIDTLKASLAEVKTAGDLSVVTAQWKAFEDAAKQAGVVLDTNAEKIKQTFSTLDSVNERFDTMGSKYSGTKQFSQIDENIAKMADLRAKYDELSKMEPSPERAEGMSAAISEINSLLGTTIRQMNSLDAPISTMEAQTKSNNVLAYLNANSKAAKEYGKALKEVAQDYQNATTRGDVAAADTKYKNLQSEIKMKNLEGLTFGDELARGFKQIAEFAGIYALVHNVMMQAPRQMFQAVKEVDAAMIELRKVSNATDVQLGESFDVAADSAKKYGVALSDVISSTADWSRLGYSLEDAQKLADATTLLQTVGDNMTQENTSQALVSTLQGFQLDAAEAQHIVDKFNEVANNYAIDTAGIGEALQRSAASFNTAHTDLDKSIALIVGANTVVQDPSRVGKHCCPGMQ